MKNWIVRWIARHLPQSIRLEVATQFIVAANSFTPEAVFDFTRDEIAESFKEAGDQINDGE